MHTPLYEFYLACCPLELFGLCWKILFSDEMNRTDWTARDVSIWVTIHVISLDSLEFFPGITCIPRKWILSKIEFSKNHKFVFLPFEILGPQMTRRVRLYEFQPFKKIKVWIFEILLIWHFNFLNTKYDCLNLPNND